MIAEIRPLRAGAGAGAGADPGHACRLSARAGAIRRLMDVARAGGAGAVPVRGDVVRGADRAVHRFRFLGRQRLRELAFGQAAALQDHRRLGQPRRLDAAVGADPGAVRRAWSPSFGGNLPHVAAAPTCSPCRRWIAAAFLLFILVTSNPFAAHRPARRSRAATSTRCCRTPASRSIRRCSISAMSASRSSFSFAVAALIEGRIDAAWARWVRPWTLAAWIFLTLGIAMGSYWAYYELGWGGWWFWDPVENASLHALARRHRAAAFRRRDGKARRAEGLDDPARDPRPSRCRCSAPSWCARAC